MFNIATSCIVFGLFSTLRAGDKKNCRMNAYRTVEKEPNEGEQASYQPRYGLFSVVVVVWSGENKRGFCGQNSILCIEVPINDKLIA